MASMTIRPVELDRDGDDLVRLVRDAVPTAAVNRATIVSRISAVPERAGLRVWVAEVDGEAVGRGDAVQNLFSNESRSCLGARNGRSDRRRCGLGARMV